MDSSGAWLSGWLAGVQAARHHEQVDRRSVELGVELAAQNSTFAASSCCMTYALKALDLSHHNAGPGGGDIDFEAIVNYQYASIRGVILKATQGVRYADPTFANRRSAAKVAGMLVGAYAFNTGDAVANQVDFFFQVVNPDDKMLCALDFEDYSASPMSLSDAIAYLELADQRLGRPFWLYSGNRIKALIADAGNDERVFLAQHPFWLAEYGPKPVMTDVNNNPLPWAAPTLWQFSGDGVNNPGFVIPGVSAYDSMRLDMNGFNGDDHAFSAAWPGTAAVAIA